jgi:hypothetical protein
MNFQLSPYAQGRTPSARMGWHPVVILSRRRRIRAQPEEATVWQSLSLSINIWISDACRLAQKEGRSPPLAGLV